MRRKIIFISVLILLILGCSVFYTTIKSVSLKNLAGAEKPILSASPYLEHTAYYDIVANYATTTQFSSSDGKADKEATTAMQKFVSDTITQFKSDGNFKNLNQNDIKVMGFDQGRKEKLEIVYLIASSQHTVSYIYTVYEDTLGAHGNTFFKTFTFDTSTGALLTLANIFTSNSQYLDFLSKISRMKLPDVIGKNADATVIENGTKPDEKNFANFFFDNHDFVILFDPYTVAPYSAGPQTLRIPLSELTNILKPEYS